MTADAADEATVVRLADDAIAAITQLRRELSDAVDGAGESVEVTADLLRRILDATSERRMNEIRHAAFCEGIESFKGDVISIERSACSTGTWHPYAYRPWDGEYGMTL